jgi:DUF1009 family protein
MPAREEISIKKIGIIAGSGVLPLQLKEACITKGIEPVVIGFRGYTDQVEPDCWGRIGASAKIIKSLKSENINDIVMIGAIKRPGLFDLWPDWITFKFFFKAWLKSFGDSGLLNAARDELEAMGFKIHGVHKFLPQLLMPEGILGQHTPKAGHQIDVQVGIKAARDLGKKDKGQAVIVKDGKIIACEDKRGTSALIKHHGCEGSILVKMCKPQQDKDLDLPTIGPQTIELCGLHQMAGIVGQAGNTLMVGQNIVRQRANEMRLFVMGVTIDEAR